jgi:hypothetical protein
MVDVEKTITLTDEELKELKGLLNVAISDCLDGSIIAPFEDLRKKEIKQANEYKKLYNKIFDADKVIEPIDTEE